MKLLSKSPSEALWLDYFSIHIDYCFILLKKKSITL